MAKKTVNAVSTVPTQDQLKEIEKTTKPISNLLTLKVTDNPSYEKALDGLKATKGLQKTIKDFFDTMLKPAKASVAAINGQLKDHLNPVEEVDCYLRRETSAYVARLDEEKRKAEAKAQAAFEKKVEKAEALGKPVENIVKKEVAAPDLGGQTFREVWEYEIIDEALLPRNFLTPDEAKLGAFVRSLKAKAEVPGIKVTCRKVPVIR